MRDTHDSVVIHCQLVHNKTGVGLVYGSHVGGGSSGDTGEFYVGSESRGITDLNVRLGALRLWHAQVDLIGGQLEPLPL